MKLYIDKGKRDQNKFILQCLKVRKEKFNDFSQAKRFGSQRMRELLFSFSVVVELHNKILVIE